MPSWYDDLLGDIKQSVTRASQRAQRAVNTELIQAYWETGHHILARQKEEGWGTRVVARLSADLKTAFPNQRGFSPRNLMYMQKMARTWPEPIVQQPVAQLPWGHVVVLMNKLETRADLDFYAARAVDRGASRGQLESWIAGHLHLTEGSAETNFKAAIPEDSEVVQEIIKDPYRLDFLGLEKSHAERDLEDAIVANVTRFLTELGVGFAFVGRQYPVVIGGDEYRIDLLFYHLKLHRYVVFELKAKEARPEHVGQLGFYVNVVDKMIRDPERDEETIGILIGRDRNRAAAQIALDASNRPLAVTTYDTLTPEQRALMPTEEDLSRLAQDALDANG
jgi:predicted nuclease of restriction endonuclease-like (RecB) superfamily